MIIEIIISVLASGNKSHSVGRWNAIKTCDNIGGTASNIRFRNTLSPK